MKPPSSRQECWRRCVPCALCKKRHKGGDLRKALGKGVHTSGDESGTTSRGAPPICGPGGSRDVESEKQVGALTGDLSVFGCFIETTAPFPRGTKVRIKINHRGSTFVALRYVSYS